MTFLYLHIKETVIGAHDSGPLVSGEGAICLFSAQDGSEIRMPAHSPASQTWKGCEGGV